MNSYAEQARKKLGQIATAMLGGTISFIEGARSICGLRLGSGLESDPDILMFVGIDDRTDALPMGEVREHWAPEALLKLQPEIENAEKWARECGLAACQRLALRFGSGESE
jgi:hypothetical protein